MMSCVAIPIRMQRQVKLWRFLMNNFMVFQTPLIDGAGAGRFPGLNKTAMCLSTCTSSPVPAEAKHTLDPALPAVLQSGKRSVGGEQLSKFNSLSSRTFLKRHHWTHFLNESRWRHVAPVQCTSSNSTNARREFIAFVETEEDFETFCSQVQNALYLGKNSKAFSTSSQSLRVLVQKLVTLGCDCRNILAFLESNPAILSVKTDQILRNIDYLHELGLNWRRLLKVLDDTSIWTVPSQRLQGRVKQLRKLGFIEGSLQKVIAEWPKVLTIGSVKVKAVVRVLMENCGFSKADVLIILTDSPSVLAEDLEDIEVKFQYLFFRMGITDNSEMALAKIYKYSLNHIRCRHLILERMGLYVAPDNRGRFSMKNPNLARIVDSSDNRFADNVAFINVEDLRSFARTLIEEVEEEKGRRKDDHMDDEGFDENNSYDSTDDDSDDSSSDEEASTEPFDFEKVDYRKK